MSRSLPQGSTMFVTIMRPAPTSSGIGLARLVAVTPVGQQFLAEQIAQRLPALFGQAALPDLLLPGPPLTMLLQTVLPDGELLAHAASAILHRAARREEMIAAWSRDMPHIVGSMMRLVDKALGVLSGDEAASPAVH